MARKKKAEPSKAKPAKAAKPAKPKAKTPARATAAPRAANSRTPRAAERAFYFPSADFDPRVTDQKPKSLSGVTETGTFEEAREQAIDALIEIIDRCEQRLWELKRANSFEDYAHLSGRGR